MRHALQKARSIPSKRVLLAALASLVASCGGGGGGGGSQPPSISEDVITGKVIDGYVASALVCIDSNSNGRCDNGESRTFTDAGGAYQLSIPKGTTSPLIAEMTAGVARDLDQPGTIDASYRMASPSPGYSTNITPYTTLVYLSGERDFALAEDLVREVVGLPPRIAINIDYAQTPGSLAQAVAKSIVVALKASDARLDLSSAGRLAPVVAAFPKALTDLPVLRIDTKSAAPIVSRENYVDAVFALTNPAVSQDPVIVNGRVRGRGHSTWGQPKNPYKVQFSNDASYAALSNVLGMTKNRNWALLADYFDKSLLRNKLVFSLGNAGIFSDGLKWNPSGQHLEVYLNGDYVGVYLLTEDIRIDPARLNIKKMSSSAAVGDVDGGYIVEVDARLDCYAGADVNLQHVTPRGVPTCIDTPDESSITQAQLAYVRNLIDGVEADLYDRKVLTRINAASFADWYLIQEVFRNNDAAFWSSDFFWKDTDAAAMASDRVVNMGPLWDFDLSAGNITYNGNWQIEGCWVSKPVNPNWMSALFDNPEFVQLVIARWKAKRPAIERFVNTSIDTFAGRLASAQQRNFARWPVLGVPLDYGDYYLFPTWSGQVAFLRDFLIQRMAWLDRAYASAESFSAMCK